jgi:hypothetical protein
MTPLDLADLKRLAEKAEKATHGPWRVRTLPDGSSPFVEARMGEPDRAFAQEIMSDEDYAEKAADAAFIAACDPQTISALVARVEHAESGAVALRNALQRAMQYGIELGTADPAWVMEARAALASDAGEKAAKVIAKLEAWWDRTHDTTAVDEWRKP